MSDSATHKIQDEMLYDSSQYQFISNEDFADDCTQDYLYAPGSSGESDIVESD